MSHCSLASHLGRRGLAQVKVNQSSRGAQSTALSVSAARGPEKEVGSAGSAGHAGSRGSPGFSRPARATNCELSDGSVTILLYRWGWGS